MPNNEGLCWKCDQELKWVGQRNDDALAIVQHLHCHHEPKEKVTEWYDSKCSAWGCDNRGNFLWRGIPLCDIHSDKMKKAINEEMEKPKCWCDGMDYPQTLRMIDYDIYVNFCPECGRKL